MDGQGCYVPLLPACNKARFSRVKAKVCYDLQKTYFIVA